MIPSTSEQLCRRYSLVDIQIATQNFDDGLVIGQGGFGKVYKGHIKSGQGSSTVVAIKRLDSKSNQGAPEFRAEVEMLSKLRHSHLVSLLGYCDEDNEMILVYQYMPHDTVYHHLHNSNTPLSWLQRFRISIGAARGLDYLHTGAGTKDGVIHRDVKTSNILLDEDWAAKISDFGLAKICPINQPSTYVHTGIKGTFGYLDPQIFWTGKFTRKTDVFAFGVVLFELLSGRLAVFPNDYFSLASWAQNCVKNRNLDEVVDAEIRGQLSPKSLKVFAQMAYRCVQMDPKERPTMSEVVVALQRSLELQEKFNNSAKPLGLIGFTWKMASYFVLPAKENSGHGDQKSLSNSKINIGSSSSSVPTEYDGDHNEVPPGHSDEKPSTSSKINISCSVTAEDHNEVPPGSSDKRPSRNSKINIDSSTVPTEDGGEQILHQELTIFSYTDLKRATRNFGNGKKTGQFRIFKGWVHEKTYTPSKKRVGLAIAVKDLGRRPEWDLQLLGEFSHPNLQRLLGYCLKDEKLYLVHEFMEKMTLKGVAVELPFITRVKIAVGVARGMVFFHRKQPIIKYWILDTDEIWLDKDFNAKLFYFDAARFLKRLAEDPLKGTWSLWRRQCDVYGLGLILMEIFTGQPIRTKTQMDLMEKEQLSGGVAQMTDKMIEDVVDSRIKLNAPQIERARELLLLIQKCTRFHYTMEQALEELEQVYNRMTKRS